MNEPPTSRATGPVPLIEEEVASARADAVWMVHLYRAIAADGVMWRRRMDVTANWAVPLLIALTTFALGTRELPHHFFLLLGGMLIFVAVLIEARRYRELHHASWRRALIDVGYFAGALHSVDTSGLRWRERLASDLARPRPTIGLWQAALVRMRSTYLVLCYLLVTAWLAKVAVHTTIRSFGYFVRAMGVRPFVPGWIVGALVLVAIVLLTAAVMAAPSAQATEDWSGREPFARYASNAAATGSAAGASLSPPAAEAPLQKR